MDELLQGPSTDRSPVDRLLLAIIDAHTTFDPQRSAWQKDRERRLAEAKRALFNESSECGPKQVDDRAALYSMAREHQRDRSLVNAAKLGWVNGAPKARSIRRLAEESARRHYKSSSPSTIDRLRDKFAQDKDFWMEMARSHDDIRESIEHQILVSLRDQLATIGITMNLAPRQITKIVTRSYKVS